MKFYQSGRSMVEMLGVLAIIGVLSVGAISGYSKAMMKYKLNKQSYQISTFINNSITSASQFSPPSSSETTVSYSLIPYYIKLGFVDEDMIHSDTATSNRIYDVFGNDIHSTFLKVARSSYIETSIVFNAKNDKDFLLAQCVNILTALKESKEYIRQAFTQGFGSGDDSDSTYQRIYGDQTCQDNLVCFKSLTLQQMHDFCTNCVYESGTVYCRIAILYNYTQY